MDELTKSAAETEEKLSKMVAPSSKLDQRIDKVKERENENLAKLDEGRKKAQSARRAFEKVKTERLKRFQDFFEPVATRIDEVYKVYFLYYLEKFRHISHILILRCSSSRDTSP